MSNTPSEPTRGEIEDLLKDYRYEVLHNDDGERGEEWDIKQATDAMLALLERQDRASREDELQRFASHDLTDNGHRYLTARYQELKSAQEEK